MLNKKISYRSKILSITHSDMDGAGSQIVLGNAFKDVTFLKSNYNYIDQMLENVNCKDFDYVIVTDISPKDVGFFERNDNAILLDHHATAEFLHDPSKNRYVYSKVDGEDLSSTKICLKWVESKMGTKLTYLKSLVNVIHDYDTWTLKLTKSRLMNELYYKYWHEDFITRFFNGNTQFNKEEISYLRQRREEFKNVYKNLDVYDLPSSKFKGCFFMEKQFVNDICKKLLEEDGYELVLCQNPKSRNVYVRSSFKNIHIGTVLEELGFGGGHESAAGMNQEQNVDNLHEKILQLSKKLEGLI